MTPLEQIDQFLCGTIYTTFSYIAQHHRLDLLLCYNPLMYHLVLIALLASFPLTFADMKCIGEAGAVVDWWFVFNCIVLTAD